MNEHYNVKEARTALERYAMESAKDNKLHLNRVLKTGVLTEVVLEDGDTGFVWRLIKRDEGTGEAEEIVFVMNRVICSTDLPPVHRIPKSTNDKPIIMAQKVTITGLNATFFAEAMETIKEINLTAQREFKEGTLELWAPGNFQGVDSLECTNRYFRRLRADERDTGIPFPKEVDPKGILTDMTRPDLAHTEENEVQYFRSNVGEDGKRRFNNAKPQMFRNGDIVEISFTVAFVRGKRRMFRLKPILRAIALLDGEYTRAANRAQAAQGATKAWDVYQGPRAFKRKISYVTEDEMEVEEGMAQKRRAGGAEEEADSGDM
ncbi:uncharacterized protein ARMOST_11517 [Armillaria ostoyae]|uniref:Uncharacterized protein n=1 Tax=Armillaria ostoyae TaxID=47428 RepID=A0A284RHB7_ARMOS|nr:uncharacterized protein ARMOST_11517 [Armillaria ostoyae]